LISKI
jgi:hypothetical protein